MNDNTSARASVRIGTKASERSKLISQDDDPLSKVQLDEGRYESYQKVKKENLTIRLEDEARIVAGMSSAAKKQTTGSIFSVVVDISKTCTLGIGVKDLSDNILAVSMLKRENNQPGPGEEAGIRLGDIIFGINFVPTREGSRTLINVIKKETQKQRKILHIQGWRCHQLCSDNIPGYLFPRADDVIVQAYSLFRTKVFSDWERWNFIEILLGHMLEDLKLRTTQQASMGIDETGRHISNQSRVRAKQMQVLDLERNILQAKGLRTAICVRIVHTKSQGETVIYVLRVEDVESGLQWVVHRRFRDFFALNDELLDMSHFAKEAEFPRKRISIRNTSKLVENRIVALEQYVRKMLHTLTLYATMDSAASRSLRHLQNFLGVDRYVDCVHQPLVDDQRYIELMAYRFLNDFTSPACQQCVRFITTVDLDSMVETGPEGYRPVLTLVKDALAEVEQFVQQQHQQQMIQALRDRRPDLDSDQLRSFVRKCIRRQVEAALYLPLRRNVFRIVYSFVAQKSKQMQRSMTLLQQATPNYLMVDAFVQQARKLPMAVKAFRRVIQAYLPADQGQLLIEAAASVTELHRECHLEKQRVKALATATAVSGAGLSVSEGTPSEGRSSGNISVQSRLRDSRGGSGSIQHANSAAAMMKPADIDTKVRGNSSGGSPSPIQHLGTSTGATRDVRRNSLSGFFRSASTNSVTPTSSSSTPTNGLGKHVDLAGKEALADPVGTIFHAADDEALQSVGHSIRGNQAPGEVYSSAADQDEEPQEEVDRVSFSVDPSGTPFKPTVASTAMARQNSNESSVQSSATLKSLGTSRQQSADAAAASALSSYEERTKQTQNAVDQLNTAIFDGASEKDSDEPNAGHAIAESETETGTDEQFATLLQRHKSVKISSLLSDILDMNIGTSTSTSSGETSGAAGSGSTVQNSESATDVKQTTVDDIESAEHTDGVFGSETPAVDQQKVSASSSLFNDIADAPTDCVAAVELEGSVIINSTAEVQHEVISADDFLPLFTFVLVQAGLPQLLLVKELMVALVDDEDTYGECGYYLATLEAATQHICDLADQYEKVAKIDSLFDDGEDIFEHFDAANSGNH